MHIMSQVPPKNVSMLHALLCSWLQNSDIKFDNTEDGAHET